MPGRLKGMAVEIAAVRGEELPLFLHWAEEEGWRVPAIEMALFLGVFSGALCALREGGRPRGFVSAVRHERSGWVGNLLVDPQRRGRGVGTALFEHAVGALIRDGAGDVWLTASPMGRPLYEKKGFRCVGRVRRWRGAGLLEGGLPVLRERDRSVWGEGREPLLTSLAFSSEVIAFGGSAALLQSGTGMRVLGPWLSEASCPRKSRQLLAAALEAAGPGVEVVADVLESSGLAPLLAAAGFAPPGGDRPHGPRPGRRRRPSPPSGPGQPGERRVGWVGQGKEGPGRRLGGLVVLKIQAWNEKATRSQ